MLHGGPTGLERYRLGTWWLTEEEREFVSGIWAEADIIHSRWNAANRDTEKREMERKYPGALRSPPAQGGASGAPAGARDGH